MVFLNKLNVKTENKYSMLRIFNAKYSKEKNRLAINFLFPKMLYGNNFPNDDKEVILEAVKKIYENINDFQITYTKSILSENAIISSIIRYFEIYRNSIIVFLKATDINVDIFELNCNISIEIERHLQNTIDNLNIISDLKNYLSTQFCCDLNINYNLKAEGIETQIDINNFDNNVYEDALFALKEFPIKVTMLNNLTGGEFNNIPIFIKSINGEKSLECICGKITSISKFISKEKQKPFYIFTISDSTGEMEIKSFSRSTKETEVGKLNADDEVVCVGEIKYDDFNKVSKFYKPKLSMFAQKISRCHIDYSSIDKDSYYKKTKLDFIYVKPIDYFERIQSSLFKETENTQCSKYFKNKTYVVFDTETTGMNGDTEGIVEIGAVKIVDGKIIQTFQTLINPKKQMSFDVINVHHITNEMVENERPIEDIFCDFYKFIENCTLVAHNASFDMGFINKAAEKLRYKITNPVLDTLTLARKYLKTKHHKLENCCEYFNIQIGQAHRALDDALATAKMFIKLVEKFNLE